MHLTYVVGKPRFDAVTNSFFIGGSVSKLGYDCQGTLPGVPYGLAIGLDGIEKWELVDNHFPFVCYAPESASMFGLVPLSDGSGYQSIFETHDRRYGVITFSNNGTFIQKTISTSAPARPRLVGDVGMGLDSAGNTVYSFIYGRDFVFDVFSPVAGTDNIFKVRPSLGTDLGVVGGSVEHLNIVDDVAYVYGVINNPLPGCVRYCAFGVAVDLATKSIVGQLKAWDDPYNRLDHYITLTDGKTLKFGLGYTVDVQLARYYPVALLF